MKERPTDTITAYDVFTPNQYPRLTYIQRESRNYEKNLLKYLKIGGTTVAISGPSKSGKTILVRRVVGDSNLILISASGIEQASDLAERIFDKVRTPHSVAETRSRSFESALGGEGSVSGMLFGVANSVAKLSVQLKNTESQSTGKVTTRRGMAQIIELLANQPVVVLIDDFHFIERSIQVSIAKAIKAAAHEGVRFVLTVASHRSDDLERATGQLVGRVANLDIEPWHDDELLEIAHRGFPLLNAANDILVPHALVAEAGGSPQLMQLICLHAALELGFETKRERPTPLSITAGQAAEIMKSATSLTQQKTTAEIMLQGPKTRGTERDIFRLNDRSSGDVYYCVLRAISDGSAKMSFTYEEIKDRIEHMVRGASPQGASIVNALDQMSKRTTTKDSGEKKLDWDEDKRTFTIVDPYIMFYLRWSGFLSSTKA
jgi:hypothetical protein